MEQQPYTPLSEIASPQESVLEGRVKPLLATFRYVLATRQQQMRKRNNPTLQTSRINVVDEYDNTFRPCLEDRWQAPQFDLEKILQEEQGTFVEVGGPTHEGYQMFPYYKQYHDAGKLSVTNIDPPTPAITKIDAKELPFENNSIPGLLSNGLPSFVYEKYIPEAYRVLKPDGILVMEAITEEEIKEAQKSGFELKSSIRREYPKNYYKEDRLIWYAILQKK